MDLGRLISMHICNFYITFFDQKRLNYKKRIGYTNDIEYKDANGGAISYLWAWNLYMENIIYNNKFGNLIVKPITDYMHIDNIIIDNEIVQKDCMFDIDTAEKIVLITENKNCQISTNDKKWFYLVAHKSPSIVCVVKIVSINCYSKNPTQDIEDANRYDNSIK